MKETLRARVERLLWHENPADSGLVRIARIPARLAFAVARDLAEGQLTLRAMSLVYTTLLSLVPLLAFSFSVLKGFGVHRQVEPLLYEFLQPLGAQGAEITTQIIAFVENIRGGVLGGIGLALLIFTVISMIQKVEDTFNYIWQVQKSRSLTRRFSDYLSVVLVGPVLMVTAMGLLATVNSSAMMQAISSVPALGALIAMVGRLVPFAMVVLAFTFVYMFVPNIKVRLWPALVGALVAGAGWTLGGSLFATVIVGSTRYAAIYSSFAIAIFALIWLYLSWLVLLIGAQIAYYVQSPLRLRLGRRQLQLTIAQIERLALGIMLQVGQGFRNGVHPDFAYLATVLRYPARALEDITLRLEAAGLLMQTEHAAFVPGRNPETITVAEILDAVRGEHPPADDSPVSRIFDRLREAEVERLAGLSLADLVNGAMPGFGPPADPHEPSPPEAVAEAR
jgi:membrane protein